MTTVELERERSIGEILRDTLLLFRARPATYLAFGFVVVAPVYFAIFGLGLGEVSAPYDDSPARGRIFLEGGVIVGVVVPLLTMMVARVLTEPGLGTRAAIQAGLELYVPALIVMAIVMVSVFVGLVAFIVPGIYFGVRMAFAVLTVALDGLRGGEALRRSFVLTTGDFWRALAGLIVVYAVTGIAGQLFIAPLAVLADAVDQQGVALAGDIIGDALTLPAGLIGVTLVCFDLRARRSA